MKIFIKIFVVIFFVVITTLVLHISAFAVACKPSFDANWVVDASCDLTTSGRIYGDIYVGPYTVTVANGVTLGIDLTAYKVMFTTGKINFTGTAKMDASITTRFTTSVAFVSKSTANSAAGVTSCPAGMRAVDPGRTYFPWSIITTGTSGTLYCGWFS